MAQYFLIAGDSAVSTMFWLVGMGVFGFVLIGAVLWGLACLVLYLVKKLTGKEDDTEDMDYTEE